MVVRVVVMSVILGMIAVCRCRRCHFQILPRSPLSDLRGPSPLA
jgi:hypothetical protein